MAIRISATTPVPSRVARRYQGIRSQRLWGIARLKSLCWDTMLEYGALRRGGGNGVRDWVARVALSSCQRSPRCRQEAQFSTWLLAWVESGSPRAPSTHSVMRWANQAQVAEVAVVFIRPRPFLPVRRGLTCG